MNIPRSDAAETRSSSVEPPYYAVIFTSQRNSATDGYSQAAERMVELAAQQPGFLGVDSARDAAGLGITVSYWRSLADITAWRDQAEHRLVRERGRREWYAGYELRIAKVERAYAWQAGQAAPGGAAAA